jgi:O-antigen ligase
VFDHEYAVAEMLYHWMRNTLLGEITFIRPGAWRIFMQSQVWLLLVWGWAAVGMLIRYPRETHPGFQPPLSRRDSPPMERRWGGFQTQVRSHIFFYIITLILTSSALMISFSRSYWVGWGVAVILFISWSVFQVKVWKPALLVVAISLIGGFALAIAVQRIPSIPAGFPLRERISLDEAGSSRVYQLKPLLKAIARHPVLGSGFGTVVTYRSADPRVVGGTAGGTGEYTTYAFEWGYLDMWLKTGLVGLISLIALMGSVLVGLWWTIKKDKGVRQSYATALFITLVGLMAVNVFSPYLNHPLGIGFVLVACALCSYPYHQYAQTLSPHRDL